MKKQLADLLIDNLTNPPITSETKVKSAIKKLTEEKVLDACR